MPTSTSTGVDGEKKTPEIEHNPSSSLIPTMLEERHDGRSLKLESKSKVKRKKENWWKTERQSEEERKPVGYKKFSAQQR